MWTKLNKLSLKRKAKPGKLLTNLGERACHSNNGSHGNVKEETAWDYRKVNSNYSKTTLKRAEVFHNYHCSFERDKNIGNFLVKVLSNLTNNKVFSNACARDVTPDKFISIPM